jgi:hypothetical protein
MEPARFSQAGSRLAGLPPYGEALSQIVRYRPSHYGRRVAKGIVPHDDVYPCQNASS